MTTGSVKLALGFLLTLSQACQFAGGAIQFLSTATPTHTETHTATVTLTPSITPDLQATREAAATQHAEDFIAELRPELEELGYSGDFGDLAWVQCQPFDLQANSKPSGPAHNAFLQDCVPLNLEAEGGGQFLYYPIDPELSVRDFIFGIDVIWDSTSGFAGCGIIFRAEDDFERGEQVHFNTLRLSGFPGWDVELVKFGRVYAILSGDIRSSSAIRLTSGSTNHYVIVAKGTAVTIYANDVRLGAVTLNEQRIRGQFGVFVFQDTGRTSCQFANGWILAQSGQ